MSRLALIGCVAFSMIACETRVALAFDDASCTRIVPTAKTTTVDLRPNETTESARARALDSLSKAAVFEISGKMLEADRASDEKDNNGEVSDQFHEATKQSYSGLVRIKQTSESIIGFSPHEQMQVTADVSVCVPKTEAELAADRERASAELAMIHDKAVRDRRPPHPVDPETAVWFDPNTGEGQLWYWSGQDQTYTFFDKDGFDPVSGEPLKRVDRQFAKDWRAALAVKRKGAQDAAIAARLAAERKAADEAAALRSVENRAAQATHVLEACDASAANPNDPRKPSSVSGVRWDDLKINAETAIKACDAAVRQQPSEPRYRYELARAYSTTDPKRSLPMFKRLCDEHYPAAYDNYGWALLDRRVGLDDLTGAVRAFEIGVSVGDSDAMTSLAGFMIRGRVETTSPDEPLQLYRTAARMGNDDAAAALAKLEADRAQAEVQRARQTEQDRQQAIQQEQAGRFFMGIVGGALGNAGRR